MCKRSFVDRGQARKAVFGTEETSFRRAAPTRIQKNGIATRYNGQGSDVDTLFFATAV